MAQNAARRLRAIADDALRAAGAHGPTFVDVFLAQAPTLVYDATTRAVDGLDAAVSAWKCTHPELFVPMREDAGGITVAETSAVIHAVGLALVTFRPGQRLDGDPHLVGLARHFGVALSE